MIRWLKKLSSPVEPAEITPADPPTVDTEFDLPQDKIAQRAYEKWVAKGQPMGTAQQDWLEAETELRAEFAGRPAEPLPNRPR